MKEKPEKESEEEPTEDIFPERPMECTECRKPIAVHYTEIVKDHVTHTIMCADCPFLQKRLKGVNAVNQPSGVAASETGLCCGNCGTTLDSVRMGAPLGCSTCYDVFGDLLLPELLSSNKISPRISPNKKSVPIHIGRAPGEAQEITPSMRLLALNEALSETLKREDYEQAALLRDQIKNLTEENHPEQKKSETKSDEKPKKEPPNG